MTNPAGPKLGPGVELDGRYVISQVIGSGGAGTVWKATDKQLGREVALKRLHGPGMSDSAALLAEAKQGAALIHQNIVQVYDIVEYEGVHLIVMEYVDGKSLWERLRDNALQGRLVPIGDVGELLRGILHGVSHAHSKRVCHRDLSPMNVLVAADGTPKIADFGIARHIPLETGSITAFATVQGGTGNPHFMSPEQARGEQADFGSDLFMVGIIAYLMLTGRHPFAHPSGLFGIQELLANDDYTPQRPDPPRDMSVADQRLFREYAALAERLLRREKVARLAQAVDAIAALEAAAPGIECASCGATVPEANRFCGQCGQSMQRVVPPVDDSSAEALVSAGYEASRLQDWESAVRHYQRALDVDPSYQKAYASLAYALNHLGQYEDAIEALSRGLGLETQRPEHRANFLYMRSFARSRLKDFNDALVDIEEALTIQGRSARYLFQRAQILYFAGRGPECREALQELLALDPAHEGAKKLMDRLGPSPS
jgi:serine/threonine protein kinase